MKQNSIYLIGVPKSHQKAIKEAANLALDRITKLLNHQKQISVVIFEAADFDVIHHIGITGDAIGKSGVIIKIDFRRKDIDKVIRNQLPATVYHEVAHLVREDVVGYSKTFLDAMVSEGIASYIEKQLQPKASIPYISEIKGEIALFKKARPVLHKSNYDYSEWFFGTGKLPKWAGYRLGYLMVESYVNKNKTGYDKLVRVSSSEFSRK